MLLELNSGAKQQQQQPQPQQGEDNDSLNSRQKVLDFNIQVLKDNSHNSLLVKFCFLLSLACRRTLFTACSTVSTRAAAGAGHIIHLNHNAASAIGERFLRLIRIH